MTLHSDNDNLPDYTSIFTNTTRTLNDFAGQLNNIALDMLANNELKTALQVNQISALLAMACELLLLSEDNLDSLFRHLDDQIDKGNNNDQ